jgi:3-hydroxyisobutyrate dehydrogenase-like beta-hydroxyacid dehydrogenase
VLASLPSLQASLEVATGAGGVIEGTRVRRFVDLSTVGSQMAAKIHGLLAAKNIVQIDSPVSGGVGGAEKGTLAVMASGPRADYGAVKPALDVIGKVFFIGEKPGSAQTMKLANNFLSATAMVATSEAVVMGVKAGLDPADIKYIIVSHAHGDHDGAVKFLQDTYKPRIIMGPKDWELSARQADPPRHDIEATDGQKLTFANP